MRIFISAGEPSGDLHAANLIHSIRQRDPTAEVIGFGGDKMQAAGARLLYPLVDLAVMWFLQVLLNINKFFALLAMADREFRENRPDAVVLIDYPGFHWWLAKTAKKYQIPVIYFVPPQLWAWAGWRIKKVRQSVDHVLCSLPFEPKWYHDRNFPNAVFIGHPYFDELSERPLDANFLEQISDQSVPLVAILPGSRTQEVVRNLPIMLQAAAKLATNRTNVRFALACLHERHRELAASIVQEAALPPTVQLNLFAARTPELIRAANVAWAVSGSVGLELMSEALPTVVVYKIRAFDLWVARKFIKSKYISLVNLMADREVMPEYLTAIDVSTDLADWAARWLDHPVERRRASEVLAQLRDAVAIPGASDRAAAIILQIVVEANRPPTRMERPDSPHEEHLPSPRKSHGQAIASQSSARKD